MFDSNKHRIAYNNVVLTFLSGFNSFYSVLKSQSIAFRKANLITDKVIYSTVCHTEDGEPVDRRPLLTRQRVHSRFTIPDWKESALIVFLYSPYTSPFDCSIVFYRSSLHFLAMSQRRDVQSKTWG